MKLAWSKVCWKRTSIYCLTMYGFQEATYTDIRTASFMFIDGRNKKIRTANCLQWPLGMFVCVSVATLFLGYHLLPFLESPSKSLFISLKKHNRTAPVGNAHKHMQRHTNTHLNIWISNLCKKNVCRIVGFKMFKNQSRVKPNESWYKKINKMESGSNRVQAGGKRDVAADVFPSVYFHSLLSSSWPAYDSEVT